MCLNDRERGARYANCFGDIGGAQPPAPGVRCQRITASHLIAAALSWAPRLSGAPAPEHVSALLLAGVRGFLGSISETQALPSYRRLMAGPWAKPTVSTRYVPPPAREDDAMRDRDGKAGVQVRRAAPAPKFRQRTPIRRCPCIASEL